MSRFPTIVRSPFPVHISSDHQHIHDLDVTEFAQALFTALRENGICVRVSRCCRVLQCIIYCFTGLTDTTTGQPQIEDLTFSIHFYHVPDSEPNRNDQSFCIEIHRYSGNNVIFCGWLAHVWQIIHETHTSLSNVLAICDCVLCETERDHM